LIEDVPATHPDVAIAAAIGQPDAYAGELPMAFVAARPGSAPAPEELVAFCREHIPERAAVPVRIIVLPNLPMTAVGKIFKPELRCRAIELVLREVLAAAAVDAEVKAGADERRGTLARIRLAVPSQREAAEKALAGFALTWAFE
jgi:fatty-acyl-CoA synthase